MKLLTKAIRKKLPALYALDGKDAADVPVTVKFFDPSGRYTFYATEGEPVLDETGTEIDFKFFGFCVSPLTPDYDELGYVSLSELESVRGALGLGIERDLYFSGKTLADVKSAA